MTRKKIMRAFLTAAIIVLASSKWHCFTAAGYGIGVASKRTVWSTPSQRKFATPTPGSRVTIRCQDSRMLTGRVREFPENSLQNYLTELSQYLEQSQRREELPQTNEEIMIRRKDGAIRKGRFWGFAFDSIIIHHDTTLVNYLFKDIAEIEATDGEYLEVRKLQDQLQARQLPIYSSMVLQTEDSVAAINLAKVDSLGWHKDFRKAGMVIGGAADLATLAGFILFMRPIFSGPILGSASVQ